MKTVEFDTTVMQGGTLRIPSELLAQLPPDQPVHVIVIPSGRDASTDARRQALLEPEGAWADDDSIPGIFEEIERERHADRGRDIDPLL